jgi:hypothetical protein
MTREQIEQQIEEVEKAIFFEQMADFMDWTAYNSLKNKLASLKEQLAKCD